MTGLRVRRVLVSAELVAEILKTGYASPARLTEGLPAGARLVSVSLTPDQTVTLLFEHESFDLWEPGGGPAPDQRIVSCSVGAKLPVQPGDVLVLRYPRKLEREELERLRVTAQRSFQDVLGIAVKILVLEEGADLSVLLFSRNGSNG
jgi:hypothetical protein